ncbi:IS110 family transposase [bacterium]|nr:IS110 family transposase [bacterium]
MLYVGLDLHERTSTLAILDPNARTEKERMTVRTIKGPLSRVVADLKKIKKARGAFAICYEASTSYGIVYDALATIAERVAVGHPAKLEAIFRSKAKNDRNDAKTLAGLLSLDIVPTVHVPNQDVRGWRRLINCRHSLVKDRTRVKNRIRALLRGLGVEAPENLWTKKSLAWLRTVDFVCSGDAVMRDEYVDRLETVEQAIRRVEGELDARAAAHPGVMLLQTIPGVGPRTAEAMVAWIDDPRRFRSTKSIGNYLGLVPCEDTSAGRRRLGHITKEGPPVIRWLLTQAAWQAVGRVPAVRAFRDRVMRGDPDRKKIATVATMHYLARAMLAMLRDGSVWAPAA